MYNPEDGTFSAPEIGSFFEMTKVQEGNVVKLLGTARINRRDDRVVEAVVDLYNSGRLKFSFEIYAENTYEEDGVLVIDAAEGNRLTAMAIVTTPAYPDAVALNLAAELDIHAIEMKAWDLLCAVFGERMWNVVWIGMDGVVAYLPDTGTMMRIDYRIEGNELIKTDEYEVTFERVEEVTGMDKNDAAVAEAKVMELDVNIEGTEGTVTVDEERRDDMEDRREEERRDEQIDRDERREEEIHDEIRDEENRLDEEAAAKEDDGGCAGACGDDMRAEVESLKAQLATTTEQLNAYKAAEETAKKAEARAAAQSYAERIGLDVEEENVKQAIENADYAALAAAVMAKPASEQSESYRMVSDVPMNPYGTMFERAN